MKPETPLPWKSVPFEDTDYEWDNDGNEVPIAYIIPSDKDYILHACNAYPKLVAALKRAVLDEYGQCLPFNRAHVALLKELGEYVDKADMQP